MTCLIKWGRYVCVTLIINTTYLNVKKFLWGINIFNERMPGIPRGGLR